MMEMKSQVFEGGNLLNRMAIACEGHKTGAGTADTTMTFVFGTLISICKVAQ